jgi:uncharacterized protein
VSKTEFVLIPGPVGLIDLAIDQPLDSADSRLKLQRIKIAWVGHPHPLFGGTRDNKVVTTTSRALNALGYITLRQNFRGVGKSEGEFDQALGETEDALAVIAWANQHLFSDQPEVIELQLSGFSFGSVVAARVAQRIRESSNELLRLSPIVLLGTAVSRWDVPSVPQDSLLIHGSEDDVIPLEPVQLWASSQGLPVKVIDGAGHFFHGQLNQVKNLIFEHWNRQDLMVPLL